MKLFDWADWRRNKESARRLRGLSVLDLNDYDELAVARNVWAFGTGLAATPAWLLVTNYRLPKLRRMTAAPAYERDVD